MARKQVVLGLVILAGLLCCVFGYVLLAKDIGPIPAPMRKELSTSIISIYDEYDKN